MVLDDLIEKLSTMRAKYGGNVLVYTERNHQEYPAVETLIKMEDGFNPQRIMLEP